MQAQIPSAATESPISTPIAPGGPNAFAGFDPPESNFWRLPNNWFDIVADFTSWAEHKVVEYILRHTWGYHEYDSCKLITMDEFMHGRKRRDGSRLDAGCGMAENSVKKGIADAVAHGFLLVEVDDSDRGRIKKYYGPRMRGAQRDEGVHATRSLPDKFSTPSYDSDLLSSGPTHGAEHAGRQQRRHARSGNLHLEGQSLTLSPQTLTPTPQPLTLGRQSLTLEEQQRILTGVGDDPPSEIDSLVIHLVKETDRQLAPAQRTRVEISGHVGSVEPLLAPCMPDSPADAGNDDLVSLLVSEGIAAARARTLVRNYPADRILRQLTWLDSRRYQNRVATLVAAIERDYEAPSPRRATPMTPAFDQTKYFRGSLALCVRCGSRPCQCSAQQMLPRTQVQ